MEREGLEGGDEEAEGQLADETQGDGSLQLRRALQRRAQSSLTQTLKDSSSAADAVAGGGEGWRARRGGGRGDEKLTFL